MQIEAGKFYKTRNGQKKGPAKLAEDGYAVREGFPWSVSGPYYYRDNGVAGQGDHPELDLVAEWQDEPTGPVRTVTRREIVPGVYGTVQVQKVYTDGVNIWANPGKWSADDLRSAAMVLSQLAEALDDSKDADNG